jgi:hypothetical protein
MDNSLNEQPVLPQEAYTDIGQVKRAIFCEIEEAIKQSAQFEG